MKRNYFFVFIILISILLIGCNTSSKPSNIRQELWDDSHRLYNLYVSNMNNGKKIDNEEKQSTMFFVRKYEKLDNELNNNEKEIVYQIRELAKYRIAYIIATSENNDEAIDAAMTLYFDAKNNTEQLLKIKD